MPTGDFWDQTNPAKPFGLFDPDAVIDIPFDWTAYLTGIGSTYSSHVASAQEGLDVVSSSESDGVVTVRVRKDPAGSLSTGQKYWVRCHIVAADGQEEDQTLWLKITEK